MTSLSPPLIKRGALIVLEGCDRSGKSTQSQLLRQLLEKRGLPVKQMCFPKRDTQIGAAINAYLSSKVDLPNEVAHLSFCANRWECKEEMQRLLLTGTTVIVDRYSFSGVAYSVAKGMDYNWCMGPERGLIRPDAVFYLNANIDDLANRANFGDERFEKVEFQKKVAEAFRIIKLKEGGNYWHDIEAKTTKEDIATELFKKTLQVLSEVKDIPLNVL